jgi:hypothetical protein
MRINAFKRTLVENGTTVLTFMLHKSSEEQRERLQARLDEPERQAVRRGSRHERDQQCGASLLAVNISDRPGRAG